MKKAVQNNNYDSQNNSGDCANSDSQISNDEENIYSAKKDEKMTISGIGNISIGGGLMKKQEDSTGDSDIHNGSENEKETKGESESQKRMVAKKKAGNIIN